MPLLTSNTNYEEIRSLIEQFKLKDEDAEYLDPIPDRGDLDDLAIEGRPRFKVGVRLPCRLNSPLISVPGKVKEVFLKKKEWRFSGMNQPTLDALVSLRGEILSSDCGPVQLYTRVSEGMEIWLSTMKKVDRWLAENADGTVRETEEIASSFANWATQVELQQVTMRSELLTQTNVQLPAVPSFLTFITKIRARMTQSMKAADSTAVEITIREFKCVATMKPTGYVHIRPIGEKPAWWITLADRWVSVYRADYNMVCIEPMPYLDYYCTRLEILHNMEILKRTGEYSDMDALFQFFQHMVTLEHCHDQIVDFMKSYEGFMNMTADFRADSRCSVGSYLDGLGSMIRLSNSFSQQQVDQDQVIRLIFGTELERASVPERVRKGSVLAMLADATRSLSPKQLLEASSLHKYCFFAVIDEVKGVKKFMARTHTDRKSDPASLEMMRCIFNREYTISYLGKHKRVPNFLRDPDALLASDLQNGMRETELATVNEKINELNQEVRNTGSLSTANHPLTWWYNLRPYDCEDSKTIGDPIELAKDKRSAKASGKYTGMDTEKELESIIRTKDFRAMNVLEMVERQVELPTARVIKQGSENYSNRLTAILKEKEKEQKQEGRLFGMFTTEGKQGVSDLMRKAEHILSYFEGNLMTPPDHDRKMRLHWMAQSLLDDKKYAVLADIEGHNQSMQWSNSGDLLESIGLANGEQGWNKLANLFGHLNLYYAESFGPASYISHGQKGGIEGWFNPVWTLHTLLVTKLLPVMTETILESEAVYSDDIAMIVSNPMDTLESQDKLLTVVKNHYAQFGMCLKLLQTVVSKYRITMLRQHYIVGVRADSTLKRILSASSMGSGLYHSDEIEASGISSAISSSLELSNSVKAQTLIKWYRIAHLTIKGFLATLCTRIDDRIMNDRHFSASTVEMFQRFFPTRSSQSNAWVLTRIRDMLLPVKQEEVKAWLEAVSNHLHPVRLGESERRTMADTLLERFSVDEGFFVLWLARLVFPVDLGGCNVQFLESMVLTGVRDNVARTYSIFLDCLKHDRKKHDLARVTVENALGGKGRFIQVGNSQTPYRYGAMRVNGIRGLEDFTIEYDESVLVGQEWPNAQRTLPPTELIRSKLLSRFKSICENESLKKLLTIEELRAPFKREIAGQLKAGFGSKVAKFYLDVSAYTILDKILGKVENTSSLLRSVPRFSDLCSTIARISVEAPRLFLMKPVFTFGRIDSHVTIQEYLFSRRCIMFPEVKFLDLIEPEVNGVLVPNTDDRSTDTSGQWVFHLVMASGMVHKDGLGRYLPPLYGAEALYKGGLRDPIEGFSHYREALLIKCVSVTKWIMFRSDPQKYDSRMREMTSISNCADLALATLGYGRFSTYEQYVAILARSEIAHRIPIMDNKPRAVCRSLPALVPTFRVITNQTWVYNNNLKDSNIHFDYWRMRPILAEAVASSIREPPRFNMRYNVVLNSLIKDARIDYVSSGSRPDLPRFTFTHQAIEGDTSRIRIQWISRNLPQILNGSTGPIAPKISFDERADDGMDSYKNQLALDFYRSLKKENLWELNPIWGTSAWKPFLAKYGDLYGVGEQNQISGLMSALDVAVKAQRKELARQNAISTDGLLVRNLISRYIEDQTDDDERIRETKRKINLQLDLVLNSKVPKEDRMRETIGLIQDLGRHRDAVLTSLFSSVILENCLVINSVHGRIRYDQGQSLFLADSMIGDLSAITSLSDRQVVLREICCHYLTVGQLSLMARRILSEIENYVVDTTELVVKSEDILLSASAEDTGDMTPFDGCSDFSFPSTIYSIEACSHDRLSKVRSVVHFRNDSIRNSGSAMVYESPFASDTYQAVKSTLSRLTKTRVIKNGDTVLDIAAGRGESAMALDELMVARISLSRKDEYSYTKHWKGIEYQDDYDLAGIRLPDVIEVNARSVGLDRLVILADISHLGKGVEQFYDRVLDMLELTNCLIIRVAALGDRFAKVVGIAKTMSYKPFISMVGEGIFQSPTVYLVLARGDRLAADLPADDDGLLISRRTMRDWNLMRSEDQTIAYTRGPVACSVLEDIGFLDSESFSLESKLTAICTIAENKYVSLLMNHRSRLGKCHILKGLIPGLLDIGLSLGVQIRSDQRSPQEWFDLNGITISSEERQNLEKHSSSKTTMWINLDLLGLKALKHLRNYHHSKLVRRICNAMVGVQLPTLRNSGESNADAVERTFGGDRVLSVVGNSRTKNLMDAFALLCNDVLSMNPVMHKKVLEVALISGAVKKKRYNDLLYYRKCMSRMYSVVSNYLSDWYNTEVWAEKLKDYVMDAFIKPGLYSSTKAYTVELGAMRDVESREWTSGQVSVLAEEFMACVDKMFDFDRLTQTLIANSRDQVRTSETVLDMPRVIEIEGALDLGDLSGMNDHWVVPDSVLQAEQSSMEQLQETQAMRSGESEEAYQERLRLMALYQSMTDMGDDFGDY